MSGESDEVARLKGRVVELEAVVTRSADVVRALEGILEAAPAFVLRVDSEGHARFLNRFAPGYSPENVYGRPFEEFIVPEYRDVARRVVERVLATGEPGTYEAAALIDGDTRCFLTQVAPDVDPQTGRRGATLVATDVTRLREREASLADRDAKIHLAVEATGLGLWTWDLRTQAVEWNAQMHRITGAPSPLLPERYVEIVHPDDRDDVRKRVDQFNESGVYNGATHRIVRPDGTARWVVGAARRIDGSDGTPLRLVGGMLDVTEQHAHEEQRIQSMKMAALGELASGVAHNFNNMLATIVPTLDLMTSSASRADQELLVGARLAADQAGALVRQLMAFSGPGVVVSDDRTERASDVACRAVKMVRLTIGSQIRVVEHIQETRFRLASGSLVAQALVNVLINARDALVEGGTPSPTIDVHAELLETDDELDGHVAEARRKWRVRVRDNGPGMAEEIRSRIFEPFYTTKALGHGTGLGLATAFAVVDGIGGTITCASEPGRGTTFDIVVPVQPERPGPSAEPAPDASRPPLTVLVVEDEELVRRATRVALTRAGHRVLEASLLAEAAELLTREMPDVMLLDQSLPDGRGPDLLTRFPDLPTLTKIVIFSGQSVPDAVATRVHGVLTKPVRVQQLIEAVEKQVGS
jgi:PAS domain S-box-containing protein